MRAAPAGRACRCACSPHAFFVLVTCLLLGSWTPLVLHAAVSDLCAEKQPVTSNRCLTAQCLDPLRWPDARKHRRGILARIVNVHSSAVDDECSRR